MEGILFFQPLAGKHVQITRITFLTFATQHRFFLSVYHILLDMQYGRMLHGALIMLIGYNLGIAEEKCFAIFWAVSCNGDKRLIYYNKNMQEKLRSFLFIFVLNWVWVMPALSILSLVSAAAASSPAADNYRSLPQLGQQQEEPQRDPAAPSVPGMYQVSPPVTFPAQWEPPANQRARCGLRMQILIPVGQLLSFQLFPHQFCKTAPLRTRSHQVTCLHEHLWGYWDIK